ncbi:sugar-binding transcriptional regulator [Anaerostipes faecalis]|uniref:sugar-binding transcriptional regulator n=1 Tax=Anaerostipes faecalis TaxID=2738446 RepID=UPI003F07C7DC
MKEYESLNDSEKRNMLATVANLYYNSDMTQNQIAERFFTSRSKISRMLKEARQLGIVEITIREPWDRNMELEQEFIRRFRLKDVRIINPKEANNTMVLQKLGEVAAYYLDNLIDANTILGISWGNTMYHTVKAVNTSKNIPLSVVPIMGAANVRKPERDALDLSKELAYAYGGTYHYIYAPLFVNSSDVKKSLEEDPTIKECLNLARNANIILTSVGSIVYKSWKAYLSTRDLYHLEHKGAIGHIGGHFYDKNGIEVITPMAGKMIGLGLEDIKRVENVVCVAGLEMKSEAILGAMRGGYIDTLITDEACAQKILEIDAQR